MKKGVIIDLEGVLYVKFKDIVDILEGQTYIDLYLPVSSRCIDSVTVGQEVDFYERWESIPSEDEEIIIPSTIVAVIGTMPRPDLSSWDEVWEEWSKETKGKPLIQFLKENFEVPPWKN